MNKLPLLATSLLVFSALSACSAQSDTATEQANAASTPAVETPRAQSAPSALANQEKDHWFTLAEESLQANLAKQPIKGPAKNVILFIGDGMDPTTITVTRIYDGQTKGLSGEGNILNMEKLPHLALSKTYSASTQTPDSAATASAMMTGYKIRTGAINVSDSVPVGDCEAGLAAPLASLGELAEQAGLSTGIVSTARLTHATPAAVYAHAATRDWESDANLPDGSPCKDIARQFVEFAYGDGIDVALGGGRRAFLPREQNDPEYENKKGSRGDGRNLVTEWLNQKPGSAYVWNSEQFNALPASTTRLLGLFEPSHMQYEMDRADDGAGEPSLAALTGKAIDILSKNDKGYFLMVEGGRIDHAHHAGNAARAIQDAQAFDRAIGTALAKVDLNDTLIIVTADHGHTLTMAGYAQLGNPILGIVVVPQPNGDPVGDEAPYKASDGKPYTTLGYANGPGSTYHGSGDHSERPALTMEMALDPDFRQQSLVPLRSETHGGQDVAIFAGGPDAYLFDGVVEENYIFHVINHALGLRQQTDETGK